MECELEVIYAHPSHYSHLKGDCYPVLFFPFHFFFLGAESQMYLQSILKQLEKDKSLNALLLKIVISWEFVSILNFIEEQGTTESESSF